MGLRAKVIGGGIYLAVRQATGMFVAVAGMILLTRALGPSIYGLYAAALGIYLFVYNLSQCGIAVYLIRKAGDVQEYEYHQAFFLLVLIGVGGAVLSISVLPVLEDWIKFDRFRPVATALFLVLPLSLVSMVLLAQLERALDYRRVALIEVVSQLAYYFLALPLAFWGIGVWAPVLGWWAKEILVLVMLYRSTRYHPRFYWDWGLVKQMLGYGFGYSSSSWIWQLRSLANPLIVGRYLGTEAVGYVALTVRLVEHLSFVKNATYRLSIAALAHMQDDRGRLSRAITEGMRLQTIALGPLLVAFGWIAPWLLPRLFGTRWLPVLQIYPFIALSYLTNAQFNLHSSALYVLGRNGEARMSNLIHIVLFSCGALLFIPRLGIVGYGWAEVLGLLSYFALHTYTSKIVGSPSYLLSLIWWAGMALPLFWQELGLWTILSLLIALLWPGTFKQLRKYLMDLRELSLEK